MFRNETISMASDSKKDLHSTFFDQSISNRDKSMQSSKEKFMSMTKYADQKNHSFLWKLISLKYAFEMNLQIYLLLFRANEQSKNNETKQPSHRRTKSNLFPHLSRTKNKNNGLRNVWNYFVSTNLSKHPKRNFNIKIKI